MHAVRYWLAKRLNELAWLVMPEPERTSFKTIWSSKMGEFTKAAKALTGDQ